MFLQALPAHANNCSSKKIDQYATVSQVYDGDTIKLSNGKKIRLIGINTPEMNYKTGKPEPYAKKAKRFLQRKILKQKIGLRYGLEKKDRHGRMLAHVFLGKLNLQQTLLTNGLAVNVIFPPNLQHQTCYVAAEQKARKKQRGLWKKHKQNIIDARHITPSQTGFQFAKGKIISVRQNKNTIWLKLSNKLSLRINQKNFSHFKKINLKQLKGKHVVVRGWIRLHKKRFYMTINHPDSLQLGREP